MAELILTEEEKAAETWLELPDDTVGKLVKKIAADMPRLAKETDKIGVAMKNQNFEKLSAEADLAINKATEALRKLFPEGTHGGALIRRGQVNPSPATVRGIAYGTAGHRGYLTIELDAHKERSRYTYRDVHYTKFIPDQA